MHELGPLTEVKNLRQYSYFVFPYEADNIHLRLDYEETIDRGRWVNAVNKNGHVKVFPHETVREVIVLGGD